MDINYFQHFSNKKRLWKQIDDYYIFRYFAAHSIDEYSLELYENTMTKQCMIMEVVLFTLW